MTRPPPPRRPRRQAAPDAAQLALFGDSVLDMGDGVVAPPPSTSAPSAPSDAPAVRRAPSQTRPDEASPAARRDGDATANDAIGTTPGEVTALADALRSRVQRWSLALGGHGDTPRVAADAVARLVLAQHEGHVCVRIDNPAERAALQASRIVAVADDIGRVDADLPLVLDAAGRLYLQRVFDDERAVARRVVDACRMRLPDPAPALLARLRALFPSALTNGIDGIDDRQAQAAAAALAAPVLVVSGGPGTGKTTTLARILDLLKRQSPTLSVALAAPTGKAAARMTQALDAACAADASLDLPTPRQARTVHAWLGVHPRTGRPRHDANHPLDIDLLVVDEASMLDLELTRQLLDALPPRARLVMLGDKDQLAAVQAGAVFAELAAIHDRKLESPGPAVDATKMPAVEHAPSGVDTATPTPTSRGRPSVVHLVRGWRFGVDSGIARLAQAVRDGDADSAITLLRSQSHHDELAWLPAVTAAGSKTAPGPWLEHLNVGMQPYLEALRRLHGVQARRGDEDNHDHHDLDHHDLDHHDLDHHDLDEDDAAVAACLDALDRWRVLCAVHDGPSGTRTWNARAAAQVRLHLTAHGIDRSPSLPLTTDPWFTGRAVMVTRNDPALGLVNGDVGVVLPLAERGAARRHDSPLRRATFRRSDGRIARWPVARLPAVETAFATSVHKAQGSEFERVTLVLPSPWQRPCTRELVYTAVTRARRHVTLVADEASLRASIAMRTERLGGLASRLDEAIRGKSRRGRG